MPRLVQSQKDYWIRAKAKNVNSSNFEVLKVSERGANNKTFVVIGTKTKADIKRIGEMVIITRPEDPFQTKYPFFTADSFIRAADTVWQKVTLRDQIMQDDVDLLDEVSRGLLADWQKFRAIDSTLASSALKSKFARLLNARTKRRIEVGKKIRSYYQFLDSLGRPNPLISSTVFASTVRKLKNQQEFDTKVQTSIENWRLLASSLSRTIPEDTRQLFLLLDRPEGYLIKAQWDKFLRRLWIKPTIYACLYADSVRADEGLSDQSIGKIKSAFLAELSLIDLSSALSMVRDNPKDWDKQTEKLLRSSLANPKIGKCYDKLYGKLNDLAFELAHNMSQKDYAEGKKIIVKIKNKIRNRYCDDDDESPWSWLRALATP